MVKTEIYKLDRIEEGFAFLENPEGEFIRTDADNLPEGAKSGDCFTLVNDVFVFEEAETKSRRKLVSSLLEDIIN